MHVEGETKIKAVSWDWRDLASDPGASTRLLADHGQEALSLFGFP